MSIATEIQRLQTAKSDIKSILESKGVRVSDSDRISDYPQLSATIPNLLTPIYFDFPRGYVDASGWKYEVLDPPKCFLDVYEVQNAHTYFVMVGGSVGTRFRVCTVTSDIKNATANIAAKDKVQTTNSPNPYDTIAKSGYPVFKATSDGYLVIQKDNAGKMGIRTIVFDITTPDPILMPGLLPVGGKIFYIDSNSDRIVKFYDANGQEIQNISVGSSPIYYEVIDEGSSGKDKYYVFDDTVTIRPSYNYNPGDPDVYNHLCWGYYNITTEVTNDTIGSGKTNTQTILAITDSSTHHQEDDYLFEYLINTQNAGSGTRGCTDWYVPSKAEIDELKNSGLSSAFSTENYLWSSIESSNRYAWIHRCDDEYEWSTEPKSQAESAYFIRSF